MCRDMVCTSVAPWGRCNGFCRRRSKRPGAGATGFAAAARQASRALPLRAKRLRGDRCAAAAARRARRPRKAHFEQLLFLPL